MHLNNLANKCGIKLDEKQMRILFTCNSFNINSRYEDYKNDFYNKCTQEYTLEQIKNIETMREYFKHILEENKHKEEE